MDGETKWEVEQLKEKVDEHKVEIEELKVFKTKTIVQLKTIFENIKEIKEGNKSMSKLLVSLIGSAVLGTVSSIFIWLIQK